MISIPGMLYVKYVDVAAVVVADGSVMLLCMLLLKLWRSIFPFRLLGQAVKRMCVCVCVCK